MGPCTNRGRFSLIFGIAAIALGQNQIQITPQSGLQFTANMGSGVFDPAAAQIATISAAGSATVTVMPSRPATSGQDWLLFSLTFTGSCPLSVSDYSQFPTGVSFGGAPASLCVNVLPNNSLPKGWYVAYLDVTAQGYSTAHLAIELTVIPSGYVQVYRNGQVFNGGTLAFPAQNSAAQNVAIYTVNPVDPNFNAANPGATDLQQPFQAQAITHQAAPAPWVKLTSSSSTTPSNLSVAIDPTKGSPDQTDFSATININGTGAYKDTNQIIVSAAFPAVSSALTRYGVLSQVASGAGWDTSIVLVNTSSSQVSYTTTFYGASGNPTTLPFSVLQQGVTQAQNSDAVSGKIGPNATVLIQTAVPPNAFAGWADVLSSGPLSGFAIFRYNAGGVPSIGTSPLQTNVNTSTVVLPYDNTGGYGTAVALANLSSSSASIAATLIDDEGNEYGVQTITLPARGHESFLLSGPNGQMPATAGRRGLVQFQNTSGGAIGALGLRVQPSNAQAFLFTSLPVFLP